MEKLDLGFWRGKKVLVTGHTGFKGSWLCLILKSLEANIIGCSDSIPTQPSLFESAGISHLVKDHRLDIGRFEAVNNLLEAESPEILIHLAAQSLVKSSFKDPLATLQTNVMGTANVLQAARGCHSLKTILVISTDKVYKTSGGEKAFSEVDSLGGADPYSASKACAEIVSESYYEAYFRKTDKKLFVFRSGNVIGGGDWAADRLIPDLVASLKSKAILKLRNPQAVRPWQHVLEPLFAYLHLIEKTYARAGQFRQWNLGPTLDDHIDVKSLISKALFYSEEKIEIQYCESDFLETQNLYINSDRFRNEFQWSSNWSVNEAIEKTMQWYNKFAAGQSASELCLRQIEEYQNA